MDRLVLYGLTTYSPVMAQVMEGVREHSRDQLAQLFEEDAFYESLADVVTDFRQQTD